MDAKELLARFRGLDLKGYSLYTREILGALILLAFGFFFLKSIYAGVDGSIRSVEARAVTARSELKLMEAETGAIDELRKGYSEGARRVAVAEKRLKSLRERLPAEKQISEILSEISAGERQGGVRVTSVKPLPPEAKGELTRLPFQLTLEGRFIPFGNYIERIENLPRVMSVDNFKAESLDGNSPNLTAQLFLSAYVFGAAR